jgi:hypothetical protein
LQTLYIRTQVSRLGTGSFILMYQILLSLIVIGAPLDCETASELIDSASNNPNKSEQLEIVRVVVAHTDPVCFKDAKAD